ncbi:hypothetical protein GWK47_030294 [Chionoecetes opilio]|uniref:Uncharacterized protein n=1 Tax=Chionoecetes opilio TaxID=41210 RepID=A0A8J5D4T2_CHIOP|nr:hypothetical protein GWK47_030294 [Chionoecetes opilio]
MSQVNGLVNSFKPTSGMEQNPPEYPRNRILSGRVLVNKSLVVTGRVGRERLVKLEAKQVVLLIAEHMFTSERLLSPRATIEAWTLRGVQRSKGWPATASEYHCTIRSD